METKNIKKKTVPAKRMTLAELIRKSNELNGKKNPNVATPPVVGPKAVKTTKATEVVKPSESLNENIFVLGELEKLNAAVNSAIDEFNKNTHDKHAPTTHVYDYFKYLEYYHNQLKKATRDYSLKNNVNTTPHIEIDDTYATIRRNLLNDARLQSEIYEYLSDKGSVCYRKLSKAFYDRTKKITPSGKGLKKSQWFELFNDSTFVCDFLNFVFINYSEEHQIRSGKDTITLA